MAADGNQTRKRAAMACCLAALVVVGPGLAQEAGRSPFSQPLPGLDLETRTGFFVGNSLFDQTWQPAPGGDLSDGLGPLYNASSCRACHLKSGRGPRPVAGSDPKIALLFALGDARGAPDPLYGHQWQDLAVPGVAAEGAVTLRYEDLPFAYPDGAMVMLQKPVFEVAANLGPGVALNPRLTPPIIGSGLIEAIAEDHILTKADPQDRNGDGISGRAARLPDGALGRFGWKAGTASVREQSALAFSRDMGLSTWLFPAPYGDCTAAQSVCRAQPHGSTDGTPEVRDDLLDLVSLYASHLAVPERRGSEEVDVRAGEALFAELGCADCHHPAATTGPDAPPALANKRIAPYSDFLLHDMGPELADATPTGDVAGSEWRTAPLWGIGLSDLDSAQPAGFLHDGRARTPEEAILWHAGEAAGARARFTTLPASSRATLLAFLNSL